MTRRRVLAAAVFIAAISVLSCSGGPAVTAEIMNHSYSRPDEVVTTNMFLDLDVDFDREVISGTAAFDIKNKTGADKLYLDTWALRIVRVTLDGDTEETSFELGDSLPVFGRPLAIDIKPHTKMVMVQYETTADARGVQWLKPVQTAGGKHPFLYTQSQSILARSWVPCQDNPGVRITYDARVHVPAGLMALMSASNAKEETADGVYEFSMPQPIPSYLLALAVGDVEYRAISDRCGVYAEPGMVDKAAWEFADMEKMTELAEEMYGPYRWEQFDVIVLPPSFPYGGMENPRLTFATPILVAGDRSLVSTIAHELAHSWSGNLVTNGTWSDFWLNEGFTTYFERRIMERLYGRGRSEMDAMLGLKEFEREIAEEPDSLDTALYIPLGQRDPDEELGWAPYEKGYLFLRLLEERYGRERFDAFLTRYFNTFAFQSMTTEKFVSYLKKELFEGNEKVMKELKVEDWIYKAGLPDNAPRPKSDRFEKVEAQAAAWVKGKPASELRTKDWSSQEWQHFLSKIDQPIAAERMASLNAAFDFSSANGEVQRSWLLKVIENKYEPAYGELETYLVRVGRRWLVRPLYTKLAETDDGMFLARKIYRRARPGYHSVTVSTVDAILRWKG